MSEGLEEQRLEVKGKRGRGSRTCLIWLVRVFFVEFKHIFACSRGNLQKLAENNKKLQNITKLIKHHNAICNVACKTSANSACISANHSLHITAQMQN